MPSPADIAGAKARRDALVVYIDDFTTDRGYPPSRTDLVKRTGVSLATIDNDLTILRSAGRVTWEHNRARTLRTTG